MVLRIYHLLVAVILVFFTSPQGFTSEKLIIGADQWPPFVDVNDRNQGICFALTESAFSSVNYFITKQIMPAKRLMNHAETFRVDAICNIWYNDLRKKAYRFSEPYLYNTVYFWVLTDKNITYAKLEDLKEYKIGILSGYHNGEEFDSATYLNKEIVHESSERLLRLLINKRIDIAVCDKIVAETIISKTDISGKLKHLPKPLFEAALYLAVSRKHPQVDKIITSFNTGMKNIRENGEYQKILKSYGLSLNEVDFVIKP